MCRKKSMSTSGDSSTSTFDREDSMDELLSGLEAGSSASIDILANRIDRAQRETMLDGGAGLHAVLAALEHASNDDRSTVHLCQVLLAYVQDGKTSVRTKRARRLVQADALSSAQRALLLGRVGSAKEAASGRPSVHIPTNGGPLSPATDALVDLFMVVANKDPKTQFKVRVGGLLHALCQQMIDGRPPLTDRLLHLLARCIRSPRNAQAAGRFRELPRAALTRASDARHADVMARHLEILYLVAKNKRSRNTMLTGGVAQRLVNLLDRLAPQLKDSDPPSEATMLIVGLLKLFANSKKGKEEVLSAGMVSACEKCLDSLETAVDRRGDKTAIQLQDAICTLCVRCVPAERFPLAGQPFPLSFTLPVGRRARTSSKGTGGVDERRATTSYERAADGGRSSDEDQEEADDELAEELGEESGGSGASDADDDAVGRPDGGIRKQSDMPRLSSYARFFAELVGDGASASVRKITVQPLKKRSPSAPGASHPHASQSTTQPISYAQAILNAAQHTHSIQQWVKIAYPEMIGPDRELPLQPLVFSTNAMRQVAAKAGNGHKKSSTTEKPFKRRFVYDLDSLLKGRDGGAGPNERLTNDDRERLGRVDSRYDHLLFESRFESGNLRAAIQTDRTHYELILQPDINQSREHYQWFYFEISNGEANVEYTFEIVNCMKTSSMFVHGMQPVAFSVGEAASGRPGWVRVGHSICYYRNRYVIDADLDGHRKDRFFSLRFTIALRHRGDVCYLAYHFPYTYSSLQASLECWIARTPSTVYARRDTIGQSLAGNPLTLITVTGVGSRDEVADRETVVFTGRVHPGESNASWIMHGLLEYLLSSDDAIAREARSLIVFKCIPMLNPDGVLSGNHRCSLAGHDLNRIWDSPSANLHPEIYHAKAIVQAASEYRLPLLFVDLHGHSRRSNCFLYGNNPDQSWHPPDVLQSPNLDFIDVAELLETMAPSFSAKNCRWSIQRSKEGSARVALWRQLSLPRAYTMECTYAGYESGPYKGYQIGISELKEIGRNLVQAALSLARSHRDRRNGAIDR